MAPPSVPGPSLLGMFERVAKRFLGWSLEEVERRGITPAQQRELFAELGTTLSSLIRLCRDQESSLREPDLRDESMIEMPFAALDSAIEELEDLLYACYVALMGTNIEIQGRAPEETRSGGEVPTRTPTVEQPPVFRTLGQLRAAGASLRRRRELATMLLRAFQGIEKQARRLEDSMRDVSEADMIEARAIYDALRLLVTRCASW